MRVFKHADYVEYWNACEEAASTPYPVAVWDSRTGSVLAVSDAARHILRCNGKLPAYTIEAEAGLGDIFPKLGCGDTAEIKITFHIAWNMTGRHSATLVFPTQNPGGRPVYYPVLPLLFDKTQEAMAFARAIARKLLATEQPHPITTVFDRLTEENASLILEEYSGQVYIKDTAFRIVASTPDFNAYLSSSKKNAVPGLDLTKHNDPHIKGIGADLDAVALNSGRSGVYAVTSRRVHEMLHIWRKIHRVPILAPSGETIGLLLALRELVDTDLTRSEMERFKGVFDIVHSVTSELPFVVFVWRDNGSAFIDYISKNILKIGVSSYEIQDLPQLAALVHPEDRKIFWDSRKTLSGAAGEVSYRLRLPGGNEMRVRERVVRTKGNGHYNWLVSRVYAEGDNGRVPDSAMIETKVLDDLRKRQVFINQMNMDFDCTTDMKSAIQSALNHVCQDMGLRAGLLFEEQEGRISLAFKYEDHRLPPHAAWPLPTRRDIEEAARIKRHDESLLTDDGDLPEFCGTLKSVAGLDDVHVAAIRDKNETFGMMCFLDSGAEWTGREHEALSQYAHTLAGFICRKRSHGILMRLAYVDHVLGIPNRAALEKDVSSADGLDAYSLIATVELLNMSMIANSYGLSYGNSFLAAVCDYTCRYFPEAAVYRVSHNQLALLFSGWSAADAEARLEGYFKRFSKPWNVLDKQVFGMAAAGIAALSENPDPEEALRQADVALGSAESLGYAVYDGQKVTGMNQAEILAALHDEASKNFVNMKVHYQPIFNLKTKRFCAVEALLRWTHPEYGPIRPDMFIELAEQSGLIIPLTHHVLKESLRQIRRWRERGITGVSVNVNSSPRFLRDKNVVEKIVRTVAGEGLEPEVLTMEITESMAIQNTDVTLKIINGLRGKGIKVAFDDFGVGYSSLSMLRNIPIDVVKLDKSFLSDGADFNQLIIGFAVDAARLQNMEVCSEGVETTENWETAEMIGVTMLQGYFLSRPAPAEQIEPLLLDSEGFLCRLKAIS